MGFENDHPMGAIAFGEVERVDRRIFTGSPDSQASEILIPSESADDPPGFPHPGPVGPDEVRGNARSGLAESPSRSSSSMDVSGFNETGSGGPLI